MTTELTSYSCDEIIARLDDYLDQELPADQTHRLMIHLDGCESCAAQCRRIYRELAELRATIQIVAPPPDLSRRIAARIQQLNEEPP